MPRARRSSVVALCEVAAGQPRRGVAQLGAQRRVRRGRRRRVRARFADPVAARVVRQHHDDARGAPSRGRRPWRAARATGSTNGASSTPRITAPARRRAGARRPGGGAPSRRARAFNVGPSVRPRTAAQRAPAERHGGEGEQCGGGASRSASHSDARRRRRADQRRRTARGRRRARGGRRACACRRGGRSSTSRTLFTTRIAVASAPTGSEAASPVALARAGLQQLRAAHGERSEEDEHEHLAEPVVGERARARRCTRPPRAMRAERRCRRWASRRARRAKRRAARRRERRSRRAARHRVRREPARCTARSRSEAVGAVGAAPRVAPVVDEVGADLQEQRAGERAGRQGPTAGAAARARRPPVPTATGTCGRPPASRGRVAAPARPARRRHGRRGKREKSGGRFSRNASRPSCASSVM